MNTTSATSPIDYPTWIYHHLYFICSNFVITVAYLNLSDRPIYSVQLVISHCDVLTIQYPVMYPASCDESSKHFANMIFHESYSKQYQQLHLKLSFCQQEKHQRRSSQIYPSSSRLPSLVMLVAHHPARKLILSVLQIPDINSSWTSIDTKRLNNQLLDIKKVLIYSYLQTNLEPKFQTSRLLFKQLAKYVPREKIYNSYNP